MSSIVGGFKPLRAVARPRPHWSSTSLTHYLAHLLADIGTLLDVTSRVHGHRGAVVYPRVSVVLGGQIESRSAKGEDVKRNVV